VLGEPQRPLRHHPLGKIERSPDYANRRTIPGSQRFQVGLQIAPAYFRIE
jgi:hypothetical protein